MTAPTDALVLVVEDDPDLLATLERALPRFGYTVRTAAGLGKALALLDTLSPDLVLTDIYLADGDGLEVCRCVRERRPDLPVIVMTAYGSVETAVGALRAGAYDFLTKPLSLEVTRVALDRAVATRRLNAEVEHLRRRARTYEPFGEIVGESPPMMALYALLARVADAPSSVLVTGESGTGKELVARALHARSPRSGAAFVALNCAALPEALLESELFGHVRGAFTDARTARTGLFVQADGGTLFLDEIGDMPPGLQAKLLRVLQERRVRPVGSDRDIGIDVRVVAATHRDLEHLVAEGAFREDLMYRLDVIRIHLPPLRARGSDVLLLAQRFVQRFATQLERPARQIAPTAARKLLDYDWPGNVRELQNCIERAVVLSSAPEIGVDELPEKVRRAGPRGPVVGALDDVAEVLPLHEIEKRYIQKVLALVGGSRTTAARLLEIDRKTLYRKLTAWEAGD